MPFGAERQLARDLVVAAVVVGHERARALVGPLHRPPERARRVRQADVLRVDRRLHAERAADVVGPDAHLVGRHAEDVDQLALLAPNPLARRRKGELAARLVVGADPCPRLHRGDDDARVPHGQFGDMRRPRDGGGHLLRLAPDEVQADVVRHLVVELRRPGLDRLARHRHRRQRLDVHLHRLRRILRLHVGLGHHAGDRVAAEAHLVRGKRLADGLVHRRAVALLEVEGALERAVRRQVRGGVDGEHAGHRLCVFNRNAFDDPVGVRAAHDIGVRLPGLVQVVGVAAFAAEEGGVFGAADGLANHPPILNGDRPHFSHWFARTYTPAMKKAFIALLALLPALTCHGA